MFNIVLYQPEIPPNTGNIMRLCTNTGFNLHLIQPLGFSLSDKNLKRANLDYEMRVEPQLYQNFEEFTVKCTEHSPAAKLYFCTTKAKTRYTEASFQPGDYLIFGPETRGVPTEILQKYPEEQKLLIPMQPYARSLNLANSVAIVVYEAWRQQGFLR